MANFDLLFEIDVEDMSKDLGELKEMMQKDLTEGVQAVASMTHAKTLELARDELNSLSSMYQDNVEFEHPEKGMWVVTIKNPAMWIEEGRKSGFMEELLNGKSSKVNAKGERYAVIPFKHNKNPSEQSAKAQELAGQIKSAMKDKGLSVKKLELNQDGSPRIGKLHSFNVESARLKPHHKDPATYGVSVYQNKMPDGTVRRDVMTFRVITEKHKEEGKWVHPGRQGSKILDKAFDWAMQTWEREILPGILESYK